MSFLRTVDLAREKSARKSMYEKPHILSTRTHLLILKKTSLLLSVTLMFRCSDAPWPSSGFSPAGVPFPSDILLDCSVLEFGLELMSAAKVDRGREGKVEG